MFACPLKTVNKNCTVLDPYTGESFNFADILNGTTEVSTVNDGQSNRYDYNVSICGNGLHCGGTDRKGVAGCQWQRGKSNTAKVTGLLSNVVVHNQGWGEWLLSFEGGDPCQIEGKTMKTVIHIECNPLLTETYKFERLGQDGCEHYFRLSITNESLCHEVHPSQSCAQENYNILALSARGNMEAAGLWNGGRLFLSVCQPLNLSSSDVRGCKAGASACVITADRKQ